VARKCSIQNAQASGRRRLLKKWNQLLRERRRVDERRVLGIGFHEEIEWIRHRHVGGQVDDDVEQIGRLGEDKARDPVAVRVLLPVQEVVLRRDVERIAENRCPAMRAPAAAGSRAARG
jgi:hypothetical protein